MHFKLLPDYCVNAGRLDADSTGLLIFTQDGTLAREVIGAQGSIEKEYIVRLRRGVWNGNRRERIVRSMRHGMELDGVTLREAEVDWLHNDTLKFVLQEGRCVPEQKTMVSGCCCFVLTSLLVFLVFALRNRQIRRMCAAFDLQVKRLHRVRVGKFVRGVPFVSKQKSLFSKVCLQWKNIGNLKLGDLKAGYWRTFEPSELLDV